MFNNVILGLLFVIILCSILKKRNIENYTILGEEGGPADVGPEEGGYKKIGNSFTAKECQDLCEKDPHCKYVNRPAALKNWQAGECWRASDYHQEITGKKASGNHNKPMTTWYHEKYIKPPPSIYKGSYGGYRYRNRQAAENKCKSMGLQLCHSTQLQNMRKADKPSEVNTEENVCNSGWTKDKRGWWVGRWRGWGCGGQTKHWNRWHSWQGSSAHCCTKGMIP